MNNNIEELGLQLADDIKQALEVYRSNREDKLTQAEGKALQLIINRLDNPEEVKKIKTSELWEIVNKSVTLQRVIRGEDTGKSSILFLIKNADAQEMKTIDIETKKELKE